MKQSSGEQGQSLVEFALMVIVLTVLLLGILDLGRAYFTLLALQDAAGEGASYASVHPTWITSSDQSDPNNITYRVKNAAPSGLMVDWNSVAVAVTNSGSTTPGNLVTVTVTAGYQLLTPLVSNIVGSPTLTLQTRSVAVITSAGP